MKVIGIYVSSINLKQYEVLNKLLEGGGDVHIFGKLNKHKLINLNNISIYDSIDKFCQKACEFDELLHIGGNWMVDIESVVNNFLSVSVKPIFYMNLDGEILDKIEKNNKATVLLVFPGSMIPLNLGSHQRVFNFLYQMAKLGISVDVLITAPKNVNKLLLENVLSFFANKIYIYKNNKKKLSNFNLIKRFVEKKVKSVKGSGSELPDLFSERLITKPTESCKRWVNSLYLTNKYKNIIVSYAWMLPSIEYIKHDRLNFKLICDTHDVQFVRNEIIFENKQRFVLNKNIEKQLELNLLKKCDQILAISESDEKFFKSELKGASKVIRMSAGFDYAKLPIKQRPLRMPFRFGFIGGKMDANVQSLLFIIDNWWPEIKKFSPDSKLYIAGSVCNHPRIVSKVFLEENIIRLGFIDSLIDFYNGIDVALNPVLVQGGLNFKSVEAVFAGKHLVTNLLGMKCLGSDFPAIIADRPESLINYLSNIEFDYKLDKEIRLSNQRVAVELFGNQKLSTILHKIFFNEV